MRELEPAEKQFGQWLKGTGLPNLRWPGARHAIEALRQWQPDLVLVGSWGERLPASALQAAMPQTRFVNCHPSLLPRHRGPNPYASVILANERETGISFHVLTDHYDAGPVLLQAPLAVHADETAGALRQRLSMLAGHCVSRLVDGASDEGLWQQARPQVASQASYAPAPKLEDGRLDWQHTDARAMVRQWRAMTPWQAVYSWWQGQVPVLFTALSLLSDDETGAAPGTLLALEPDSGALHIQAHGGILRVAEYRWPFVNQFLPPRLSRPFGLFFRPGGRFSG